ncbi:MAG: DUF3419 family protein [Ferruginibacter sp.]|nr:DUF3419 family protein [Cytophagales bacterium]
METITPQFWQKGNLGQSSGRRTQPPPPPAIVFGQVREDPLPELLALREMSHPRAVFCVASGGCTAFALLLAGSPSVVACDINPAQIALVELKKAVLAIPDPATVRRAFFESAIDAHARVADALSEEVRIFWRANASLLKDGLHHSGLVDRKLRLAIQLFYALVHSHVTTKRMLGFDTLATQRAFFNRVWRSRRWKACFQLLTNRRLLRLVYGKEVLDALPANFAGEIQRQVEEALVHSVSIANPYLWQTFLPGIFPPASAFPDYLQDLSLHRIRPSLPNLILRTGDAAQTIRESTVSFDLYALSNLLELVSPAYAEALAETIAQRANPGALIFLRFIFTPPAAVVQPFSHRFVLQEDLTRRCIAVDRGLFGKNILVFKSQFGGNF